MLRSPKHLQLEIGARQRIAALMDSLGDDDEYARQGNDRLMARAVAALSDVSGDLEWAWSGAGVYNHSIQMRRLAELIGPLGQALRWISRDIMFAEGQPLFEDVQDLAEPVISGMFDGSFGIRISRPPLSEQVPLTGETIFERAVTRMVEVLEAAHADNAPRAILESVTGLRAYAVSGLNQLAEKLAEDTAASWLRWQGSTIISISRTDAEVLTDTLSRVSPNEREITVRAVLEGGDLANGQFHLREPRAAGDKHYRGKAEQGIESSLAGIPLGALVRAGLTAIETESPLLATPRETYVLRSIEVVEEPR